MRRSIFYLLCLALTGVISSSAVAEEPRNFSQPFIQAAKTAQPGVISVKARLKRIHRQGIQQEGERFFPNDFWERFFGFGPFDSAPKREKPSFGYGSGFIVSEDGYILTNNHVLRDASSIVVQLLDGNEYQATKVGSDASTDIALLKIDAQNLPALSLADSSKVEIGELVLAIGNPFGSFQASVTAGVISAKGRSDLDLVRVEKFFQTDAAINLGNSGGPLVNLAGEVIGMNTAIATHTGGYLGIGFAIPSNLLRDVMKDLLEHGQLVRGYLGVTLQRVDADIAKALDLERPYGALVSEVVPQGPADKAGLQSGDLIIEIDGKVIDTVGSLRNIVALMKPEEELTMKVLRDGEPLELTASISQFPDDEDTGAHIEDSLGLLLEPMSPALSKRYHLDAKKGLLVVQIDPDSQAYQAGLRAGHVILAINGRAVNSIDEFSQAVKKAKKGGRILLQVKIGPNIRFIPLVIE